MVNSGLAEGLAVVLIVVAGLAVGLEVVRGLGISTGSLPKYVLLILA